MSTRGRLNAELADLQGGVFIAIDADDTLFKSSARIAVRWPDGRQEFLSSEDYAKIQSLPHEPDFSEFFDAQKFAAESQPFEKNLAIFKVLQEATRARMYEDGSRIVILTARNDLDSKDLVLSYLESLGIDTSLVHFERAGRRGTQSVSENKKAIVREYLDQNSFKHILVVDDSSSNLNGILSLASEYPEHSFLAYKVKGDGQIDHYADAGRDEREAWAKQIIDEIIALIESKKDGRPQNGMDPGQLEQLIFSTLEKFLGYRSSKSISTQPRPKTNSSFQMK